MKTCATCRWWQHPIERMHSRWMEFRQSMLGLCQCESSQRWYEHALPHFEDVLIEETTAIVEYDENWGMITGPRFGCAHHSAKDSV